MMWRGKRKKEKKKYIWQPNKPKTYLQPIRSDGLQNSYKLHSGGMRWLRRQLNNYVASGATGLDEIRPGYLKALDILGLSWLTCLSNIAWTLGALAL